MLANDLESIQIVIINLTKISKFKRVLTDCARLSQLQALQTLLRHGTQEAYNQEARLFDFKMPMNCHFFKQQLYLTKLQIQVFIEL